MQEPDPNPELEALISRRLHLGQQGTIFLPNARDFVMNNPAFHVHGDHNIVILGMKALSERVIEGAEYDSSLRDPPPLCHPGTRIQLHGRINTWFHDKEREKALLWLNGPAGVGKSAVVQTFAESLADSNCLGAALFFSKLNDRKDPQRVFTTIAFQLATRIPAYRTYITEQIALDPSLLKKGMKDQFRIFITEPFGSKGIGKGEGPWGVLLDGLDECEGTDQQCRIVRLVSEFALKFPHVALVWIIASRPEPHIVAAFADKVVAPSHWSEYISINSTEACQDVERYLNTSFEAMREQYLHVPSRWPSQTQFLKLTNGALGLFVFAKTAVRFMEDPNYADPVSRLNLILSVIDRLDVEVTDDHPFALLDVLYTHILKSIPPALWRTTKRILEIIICSTSSPTFSGLSFTLKSRNLMATSVILGLESNVVYSSLHKLHSVLKIPDLQDAYESQASLLHASFGEYLTDATRSKDLFIDRGECVDDITCCLYKLSVDKPWDKKWTSYASQLSRQAGSSFYQDLKRDAETGMYYAVTGELRSDRGRGPFKSQQDRSECLDVLGQMNTAEPYWIYHCEDGFTDFLFRLWDTFPEELESRGLCKQLQLRDLKVDHLDYRRNKPICISSITSGPKRSSAPGSSGALQAFVGELQSLQRDHPDVVVLVCGSTPEKRNAFMRVFSRTRYYCIPYPHTHFHESLAGYPQHAYTPPNEAPSVLSHYNGLAGLSEPDTAAWPVVSGIAKDIHQNILVAALREEEVQYVVDSLNEVLYEQDPLTTNEGRYILFLLSELASVAQVFPRCYELKGVDFDFRTPQGVGDFADIYKGTYQGKAICLKIVHLFQQVDNSQILKMHTKELILWAHLRHQNILPFYGAYFPSKGKFSIVSPWINNGKLSHYLKSFPETPRNPLASDIIAGLSYLHRSNIVHGDLKARNVLISDYGRALLTDFGMSTITMDIGLDLNNTPSPGLTIRWAAPEILEEGAPVASRQSDVWSLGCLLYEAYTRKIPFFQYNRDHELIRALLISKEVPIRPEVENPLDNIDDQVWGLMTRCWNRSPEKRPSCEEVQQSFAELQFPDDRPPIPADVEDPSAFRKAMKAESGFQVDYENVLRILRRVQRCASQ